MTAPTITNAQILAEFERVESQRYGFSQGEICILVAANLGTTVEAVQAVIATTQHV